MGLHTGEPVGGETGLVGIDIHRAARICAAGHGGQILISEATRALVAGDLPDSASLRDLGEHRLKDLTRAERLFQVVVSDLPDDFPPLRSLSALPNNLPHQWTSFIGREKEMADLRRLIETHRLVTLTGIGGAGKTRLALQVAADLLGEFPDGVWFVELAALSDPAMVPYALAATLGVREEPKRPLLETLTDYLRSRHPLLILDNCEHLVAACAYLTEALLRDCQHVRILATSREALGIPGEVTYPIPSLSIPEVPSLDLERLTTFEAVRLFVDRASAAVPAFALRSQNAGAVATICRRLDGIPLAIELVAPRVKAMTLEQIAERLHDRFRLLTGGSRTALPRHQTLHAAMDWSYQLLTATERATLRRLSVFAGGFALEAVEAVCTGEGIVAADVLELVTRLVEKSLVVFEESAGRYGLLETVRQFARDRLLESGEVPTVRTRDLDWFLALAERGEPARRGPEQETWLNRLEREHDNFRVALEWALEGPYADKGLRLAGALGWFWIRRGFANEGREWLDRALAADGPASPERAMALFWVANTARFQLDSRRLARRAEEYRALARELGDRRHEAYALCFLGIVAAAEGSLDAAEALCEEGHSVLRELNDTWGVAWTLQALAFLAAQGGDLARARALHEERLVLERTRVSISRRLPTSLAI
ncbi:MAG: AAA family ATPase [bacterium]